MNEEILSKTTKFLTNYLDAKDKALPNMESQFDDNKKDIIKAAWYGIKMNSIWLIKYLRASMHEDYIVPIPYYEIAFACRILMEIGSDFNYLFTIASEDEIKAFLKERFEIFSADGKINKMILQQNYSKKYSLNKKTIERIEYCYAKDGLAHYNSLCWNTHFNYIGYIIASQDIFSWKLRAYDILYILISINTFYDTLQQVCLLRTSALQEIRIEANTIKTELESYLNTLEEPENA